MGTVQDIVSGIDVDQLAAALGQDPAEVTSALSTATGALLGGLENNAGSADGAVGLANALGQHMASPGAGDAVPLGVVDVHDGAKIVNHAIDPEQQRALFSGSQGSLVQKLLPLVAPIVLAYLAKRLGGSLQQAGGGSSGLGDVLGGLLGGQSGGALGGALGPILGGVLAGQAGGQTGDLGGLLGQILGGAQSGSPATTAPGSVPTGGGLGDLLGQVLGGVTQQASASGISIPDPGLPAGQAPASGAGDALGGLLKGILFGN